LKILGVSGSPRRGGNTEVLLEEALKGAREAGAEVEERMGDDASGDESIERGRQKRG